MYKLMTPGPTQVFENVRKARSLECTNPDLDEAFYDFYKETCELISSLLHTKNETLILSGEGILGLEAACASLSEPGDKVLVLDNGIYGKSFGDFAMIYGAVPTFYTVDDKNPIDPKQLEKYLKKNHDFKYATLVHCDTPSGMLNDIKTLCPLLKKYGILTVVDSVSGMFGEEVRVDDYGIDVLCGASQKAVSAPAGLTFVVISEDAKKAMETRKTKVASFYANLAIFKGYYEKKWFPYTMPISDIYGLRAAFDNIKADTDRLDRHTRIADACRKALTDAGLQLYQESGFSNTVTVFKVPEAVGAKDILDAMKKEHNIMLSGSFGALFGQVIRIGHMGANASEQNVAETLEALDQVFQRLGVALCCPLKERYELYTKNATILLLTV
ncbi:alanine--glyoxylate aminotransferase family protein [Lachnospiraceae bacterium ZAX-1]